MNKKYRFIEYMEFDEFKERVKNDDFEHLINDTPFSLKYKNMSIDLTVTEPTDEGYIINYYVVIKNNDRNVYNNTEKPVNLNSINTIEELEKEMFDILVYEIQKNNY